MTLEQECTNNYPDNRDEDVQSVSLNRERQEKRTLRKLTETTWCQLTEQRQQSEACKLKVEKCSPTIKNRRGKCEN